MSTLITHVVYANLNASLLYCDMNWDGFIDYTDCDRSTRSTPFHDDWCYHRSFVFTNVVARQKKQCRHCPAVLSCPHHLIYATESWLRTQCMEISGLWKELSLSYAKGAHSYSAVHSNPQSQLKVIAAT